MSFRIFLSRASASQKTCNSVRLSVCYIPVLCEMAKHLQFAMVSLTDSPTT